MSLRISLLIKVVIASTVVLSGCSAPVVVSPTEPIALPTKTSIPPTPTINPTPTEPPYFVDATVWSGELQVPILIYHFFIPDHFGPTTAMKMQLSEFENELQSLYDAGFSLVSLMDWITGSFTVPQGRRPLILTIDDAWHGNQLFIQDDGSPSALSGLGILWEFYESHPDFGFNAAVFYIMNDKLYPDTQVVDRFLLINKEDDKWKDKFTETLVWAIENGVEVYNHTFNHFVTWPTHSDKQIQSELWENDVLIRYFIERNGRSDLISELGNIIALPEGKWPVTQSGKSTVINYKNPEGKPVIAVMEAYNMADVRFTPSVFSAEFNAFAIPRITASPYFVNYIIDHKDEIPTAMSCQVGPISKELSTDLDALNSAIGETIQTGRCAEGIYNINGNVFIAKDGTVVLYAP